MKLTSEDILKNSFFITIDKSKTEIFEQTFKYHNLFPLPKKYCGFQNVNLSGPYKCSLSHIAIIKMAQAIDLPYVCIFEDDAYPIDNAYQMISDYLSDLPDNISIIVLGYSTQSNKLYKINNYISKQLSYNYGSHSYIIFKNSYNKFINFYEKNPNTPADVLIFNSIKENIYTVNQPLFIQFQNGKSMTWNGGYAYPNNIGVPNPPTNFSKYTKIRAYSKCIFNTTNKECLIVGSNPSIKTKKFGEYIDNANKYIIRINRHPLQEIKEYEGTKTDFYFGCDYLKTQLNDVQNKILLTHQDILDISEEYYKDKNTWLTTGLICVLIALKQFSKVYIVGFGKHGDIKKDNQTYECSYQQSLPKTHHDLNHEHKIIDQLEEMGKIIRIESII